VSSLAIFAVDSERPYKDRYLMPGLRAG